MAIWQHIKMKEWSWARRDGTVDVLKQRLNEVDAAMTAWSRSFLTCETKDVRAHYGDDVCTVESANFVKSIECVLTKLTKQAKKLLSRHRVELEYKD